MTTDARLENVLNACTSRFSFECAVCVDDFADGESIVTLPNCKHHFHRKCVEKWWSSATTIQSTPSCPLCKSTIQIDKDTQSSVSNSNEALRSALRSALLRVSNEVYVPSSVQPQSHEEVDSFELDDDNDIAPPNAMDDCIATLRDLHQSTLIRCYELCKQVKNMRSFIRDQPSQNIVAENGLARLMRERCRLRRTCRSIAGVLSALSGWHE